MDFKPLYEFIDYITKMRIPGAECRVTYKNEPVFSYVSGYCDIESKKAMQKDMLYNMYSATKPITCAAALKLFEQGKFDLDDPVAKFLPEFSEMYVKKDGAVKKCENKITIKQLFTMTSGISFNVRTKPILSAKKEGRTSTREIVREIAKDCLMFEPGEGWFYGLSHDVLGALTEEISGLKFSEYLKKNIFEPLGMENTFFHLNEENSTKMATQYFYNEENRSVEKVSLKNNFKLTEEYESGGAGLISTASDYMHFTNAMTNLGKSGSCAILKPETVNLMRQNHLTTNQKKSFVWESMPDYSYGLGVRVMAEREKYKSPSNNGEFGWGGAAGAFLLSDPEAELSVVYFQHMLNSWEEFVHPRIRNITYNVLNNS